MEANGVLGTEISRVNCFAAATTCAKFIRHWWQGIFVSVLAARHNQLKTTNCLLTASAPCLPATLRPQTLDMTNRVSS
jgi:hypothetical protein